MFAIQAMQARPVDTLKAFLGNITPALELVNQYTTHDFGGFRVSAFGVV
jgi:hypothetical protein